jgi:pimeloyl-ACP methyl ester carboxylesterase
MRTTHFPDWNATIRFHDIPGPGRPLVLLHGLGCASSCDYPRVVADPELGRRRLVLVDLFGSGFSDRPAGFPYTVEAHAEVLAGLVRALGIGHLDIYGHSMGGSIAIVAASLLGDQVSRLVVSEPNLDPGGGAGSRGIAAQPEEAYVARGHDELARQAAADGDHVWAGSIAVSYPIGMHRAATSLVRGGTRSWRELLYELPLKRTVIFGERSLPDPDTDVLPASGVGVDIVPRAGHSMMWENPEGLARAIERALS